MGATGNHWRRVSGIGIGIGPLAVYAAIQAPNPGATPQPVGLPERPASTPGSQESRAEYRPTRATP